MAMVRWFRPTVSALSILASTASIIALVWVWQWAVTNNSTADAEHQHLLQSTFIACLLIAAPAILARSLDRENRHAALGIAGDAAAGAFVSVLGSVAGTMLVMWLFRSPDGRDEPRRTLFEVAYVFVAVLSLVLGALAAFAGSRRPTHNIIAAALAILIVLIAWSYLAVGASELNKCVATRIEFPLQTTHSCSGE